MSFPNRDQFQDNNRLNFQSNNIPRHDDRLPFESHNNRFPSSRDNYNVMQFPNNQRSYDRLPFRGHDMFPSQQDNVFQFPGNQTSTRPAPNRLPFEDHGRFPSQENVMHRLPFPVSSNRLPSSSFQDVMDIQSKDAIPAQDNGRLAHQHQGNNTNIFPFPPSHRLLFQADNKFPCQEGSTDSTHFHKPERVSSPVNVLSQNNNGSIPEKKVKLAFDGNNSLQFRDDIRSPRISIPANMRFNPQILNDNPRHIPRPDFPRFPPFPNFPPPTVLSSHLAQQSQNVPLRPPLQLVIENQTMNRPLSCKDLPGPLIHNLPLPTPRNVTLLNPSQSIINTPHPLAPSIEISNHSKAVFNFGNTFTTQNHVRPILHQTAPHIPNQVMSNITLLSQNVNNSKSILVPLPFNNEQCFPPPPALVSGQDLNNVLVPIIRTHIPLFRPPVTIHNSSMAVDLKTEYKEIMVDIVEKWTKSRNSFALLKLNDTKFIRIHKYKEMLKVFVGLIDKLRSLNDSLAENMQAEKSVWTKLIVDVTNTKNEVLSLQFELFNPEQVKFITNLQTNRKKKRDRIRRRKKERSEMYITSLSKRIKINEDIDEFLQKERTKHAMEKMVETLKNEAGESLVEVKRKQADVAEYISIFNLLTELRDIRKTTAIYKGIFVTEKDNEKFANKITGIIKLLSNQKKVYEDEERALRVLREEEAEEMNRLENEKRKKRKQNRQVQLSTVDPMFPFRLYWLQGEESISGLVHVRRMWDIFLCQTDTPGGTRIPKYFPEPCEPSSKEWAKFLVRPKVRKRKSDYGASRKSY